MDNDAFGSDIGQPAMIAELKGQAFLQNDVKLLQLPGTRSQPFHMAVLLVDFTDAFRFVGHKLK